MKRYIICLILLLGFNKSAIYCQQPDYIRGKVINSKTLEPVPYATVRLINSQVGVISNAEGDFRLLNSPGFHYDSLIVSCIGFHKLSLAYSVLSLSEMNNLKLVPNIYGLNEVKITARKKRLSSEIIIARAIRNIKRNNPIKPFSYVSYYRKGAIFIQPDDYSIHRLEYSASYFNSEKKLKEIFNIEIEYGHEQLLDSKMCLRYISFNNVFIIPDSTDKDFFKIMSGRWVSSEPYKDNLSDLTTAILFNNEIDSLSAQDRKNYDITLGHAKARIRKIKVDGHTLFLTIFNEKYNVNLDSCRINITNLKDNKGKILNKLRDLEIRQYRELFVQEYNKPVEFQNSCFIESKPLDQNCISHSENTGRFWMNTPLKAKEEK